MNWKATHKPIIIEQETTHTKPTIIEQETNHTKPTIIEQETTMPTIIE